MGTEFNYNAAISGGAYEKIMIQKNLQTFSDLSTPKERQAANAAAEALEEKLKGVTVTISPESVEFLDGVRERKEAQRAEEERIRQEYSFLNPENAFNRIGTQFGIISDELSKMGFYDNLSDEEILQIDRILSGITHGMNSVCSNVKEEQSDSEQLSSYAARFELESSTAALRQFSEKFVPNAYDDVKNKPTTGDVLPYDNFPMIIEESQVFVIDYTKKDGSVVCRYYRSDGNLWQDLLTTEEFCFAIN